MELEGVVNQVRVIIFGAGGYIGSEFRQQMTMDGIKYYTMSSRNWATYAQLSNQILSLRPTHIINCAAYVGDTCIADCETNKSAAILSNVMFVKILTDICFTQNVVLCHVSTGCLYTGYPTGGFKESDPPNMSFELNNCSFYTGTKVLAEQLFRLLARKYIWRIRLPFESYNNRRNYFTKLLSYEQLISVQNSLSHKSDFVKACLESIQKEVSFGTYNMTNPGSMSAKEIVELMKKHLDLRDVMPKKEFKFLGDANALADIPRSNTILNTDKLKNTGIHIRPVQEAVEDALKNWRWI
jgi:dTDP-4-dehydrorhamnose reductase